MLGELSLTERNFLGRGQYLYASIGASSRAASRSTSFTEPYFMGLKVSAGVDLYHRITDGRERRPTPTDDVHGRPVPLRPAGWSHVTSMLEIFTGIDRTVIADSSPGGTRRCSAQRPAVQQGMGRLQPDR